MLANQLENKSGWRLNSLEKVCISNKEKKIDFTNKNLYKNIKIHGRDQF